MAAPDPLRGTPEEFTHQHWREAVASFRPSGANLVSRQKAEAALVGYIDAVKIRGCLRYCLGYNAIKHNTGSAGTTMHRTNPVYHPLYPELYCTGTAEEEFSPTRGNVGVATPKVLGSIPAPALRDATTVGLGGGSTFLQPVRGKYRAAKVTLRFEPLLGRLLNDEHHLVADHAEYQRNTWIDQEPRVDVVSLSGFQLRYTEGTGLPAGYSSPFTKTYPAEIGQIIVKSDVRVTWRDVPEEYLFGQDDAASLASGGAKIPTRILYRLGTVNDDTFMGYARGTLALMGARLARTPWPLWVNLKEPQDAFESKWEYTVEFLMTHFDPNKGFTGNPAAKITTNRGWNNSIWRGDLSGAADGNAGMWFLATYDGQVVRPKLADSKEGANCQFAFTNFKKLFDAKSNGLASGE